MHRARRTLGALTLGLVAAGSTLAWTGPFGDAQADYDQLRDEFREAQSEFRKQVSEIRKAEGAEAAEEFSRDWNPALAFVDQFAEKGREYAGTPGAVQFWVFVVENDMEGEPGEMCVLAFDTLLDDHESDAAFVGFVEGMGRGARNGGAAPRIALLNTAFERAKTDKLKFSALYARGIAHMAAGREDEQSAKQAIVDLKAVIAKYGEEGLGSRAAGVLFEAENLQIGCTAPDIEGNDLSGVAFKLSDYRGKVVVIDFWGDW